ncbi:HNH endonuclease [Candidatus Micrarchaeota archaeon]|nr:HNH endonuclease [Candidatus Micrarchaeota archaeon]
MPSGPAHQARGKRPPRLVEHTPPHYSSFAFGFPVSGCGFWNFAFDNLGFSVSGFDELEKEITKLMQDEDVTKKSGIYPYVLTREEKYLNIRAFTDNQKREAYERQKGICPKCKEHFEIGEMEADHIKPWHEGGKTTAQNCQMLCKADNRAKSGK